MGSSGKPGNYPGTEGVSTEGVQGVTRSAGVVAGATLGSRVLGLVRDVVLANVFLPGATDAFFVAFTIPNLFRRLVAEGSLTVSFVPVFTAWLSRSREEARRVFDATWTLAALVGLAITVLGIFFAEPLVRLFAPGFVLEPGKQELCVLLLQLCFPYILLLILVSVAMGALNAVGHFLAPAAAPMLLNIALITGALVGSALFEPPILALGVAVGIAGVLQVLAQLPPLRTHGLAPRPRMEPSHPAVRRIVLLMGPAVLGASVFQLNVLVSRFLASFLGDGAVSYLYYADRLLEFPLGVFVFALGTASLPSFARLATAGDHAGLRDAFTGTLGLALALTLPSTVGLILLREEIFRVLFSWDAKVFGDEAVRGCAWALYLYALGLVPITVSRICVGLCFAHENARSPARGAVVAFAVHLVAALAIIGPLPEGGLPAELVRLQHRIVLADLGYAGLAAAASIAALANAAYLLAVVVRRYGPLLSGEQARRLARLGIGSVVMALAVEGTRRVLPAPEAASLRGAALLMAEVGVGVASYALTLWLLRSPELREFRAAMGRRKTA
jgi:putative peptidoglycan lipid II flippase